MRVSQMAKHGNFDINNNFQTEKKPAGKALDTAVPESEPAVIVDISKEGRQYAIGQQITDLDY